MADAGGEDTGAGLLLQFAKHLGHDLGIRLAQMTYGLIQSEEIRRLAEGADESDTLLLTQREAPTWGIQPVLQSETAKHLANFSGRMVMG